MHAAHFREFTNPELVRFRFPVSSKKVREIDEFADENCKGKWFRLDWTEDHETDPSDGWGPVQRIIGYVYLFENVSDAVLIKLRFS